MKRFIACIPVLFLSGCQGEPPTTYPTVSPGKIPAVRDVPDEAESPGAWGRPTGAPRTFDFRTALLQIDSTGQEQSTTQITIGVNLSGGFATPLHPP